MRLMDSRGRLEPELMKVILMEYVSPFELFMRSRTVPTDAREALDLWTTFMRDLTDGINCVTPANLYYTDIKVQNLLVSQPPGLQPRLLLADIGSFYEMGSGSHWNMSYSFTNSSRPYLDVYHQICDGLAYTAWQIVAYMYHKPQAVVDETFGESALTKNYKQNLAGVHDLVLQRVEQFVMDTAWSPDGPMGDGKTRFDKMYKMFHQPAPPRSPAKPARQADPPAPLFQTHLSGGSPSDRGWELATPISESGWDAGALIDDEEDLLYSPPWKNQSSGWPI